jgi:hypothetical protein
MNFSLSGPELQQNRAASDSLYLADKAAASLMIGADFATFSSETCAADSNWSVGGWGRLRWVDFSWRLTHECYAN